MGRYILQRFTHMIPVLFGVTLAVFLMLRLVPGDPATIILGERATDERIANLRHNLGLDQPVTVQYALFLGRMLRGDLGTSLLHRMPISQLILERLPVTIMLVLYSGILSILITVPVAMLAALKRDTVIDHTLRGTFLVGLAMPNFWVGLLLVLLFSIRLRWFPVSGFGTTWLQHLRHLFLPALTITLYLSAMLTRSLRSSILETMGQPFVMVARAKGLPERLVLMRHVLRNSLISTVTILGLSLGYLLGGSVVVETVFAIPGVGALMINAIYARDYPMVQGITLIYAVLIILANLITDITYSFLDPRVRYD
ncbi:MAG: ABC transporter permease [Ardenticatenaceae bacterium]|nr:ABC transporter permease [Ardenticatenaceae bacterium]HBY95742.1 ABC transporter permease [Chloroflexota bacterium]